jgi:hypothetical protein
MAMQQSAQLVRTQMDAGDPGQVGTEPRQRPGGKPISERERIGHHGLAHLLDEWACGLSRPTRRLDRPQGVDASLAVQAANPSDRVDAAMQILGDGRDGVAGIGLEDD